MAWPLMELLKRDNIIWGPEADSTFQTLKTTMAKIPILTLHDFSQLFVLETDASSHDIGAVLL